MFPLSRFTTKCTRILPKHTSKIYFSAAIQKLAQSKFNLTTSPKISNPNFFLHKRNFTALASLDTMDLSGRQAAVLLERIPEEYTQTDIQKALAAHDINVLTDDILIMKSRLGKSVGRCCVLTKELVKDVESVFPEGATVKSLDEHDVGLFVEQCERYTRFSDDLRRISQPSKFLKTVTITDIPKTYGRNELASVIEQHCGVQVDPKEIIFRFSRFGLQSDTAFVVTKNTRDAERILNQFQEVAVPKSVVYGSLLGCAFLWASRATVFLSNEKIEKALMTATKNCLLSFGWSSKMQKTEFISLMNDMKIFPERVFRQPISCDNTTCFMMEFHNMDMVKIMFQRLHRLKRRWNVKPTAVFYAYPRLADVHYADVEIQADEDEACDSDLEEPAHY